MVKGRGCKRSLLLLIPALFVLFYGTDVLAAGRSSLNYSIERDVMVKAGGTGSSANYVLNHSLGQASITGLSASGGYDVFAGFWNTGKCFKGDVNRSREVDIFDVVISLRILFDIVPPLGNGCEVDVDSSQVVDLLDVMNILRLTLQMPVADEL